MQSCRWGKRLGVIYLLGWLVATGCAGQHGAPAEEPSRPPLEIMYVANEGVLLETGEHKVLIDALFNRPNPVYAAPPDEMLGAMLEGRAPFDDVDLALVTHDHADHFDATVASLWLEQNPDAVLVAAIDAVAAMRYSAVEWEGIHDRVIAIELEPETVSERTVKGVGLTIYRTLHSGNRKSPQNLMYRVDMDGRTVFHEGDSDGSLATFARLDPGQKSIEVALVHYWLPLNPDGARILEAYLKAEHVGLFHLPLDKNDEAPGVVEQIAPNYHDLFLFVEPGQRKTIP
jgi:L-ascorbate metabolism protein UlaG (beta-lactamase superfamily)